MKAFDLWKPAKREQTCWELGVLTQLGYTWNLASNVGVRLPR